MPEILVDLDDGRGLQSPDRLPAKVPNDLPYFLAAAQEAARSVDDVDRFVIAWSRTVVRMLTPRDVLFLVGDHTSTPLCRPLVCPVFRTHGEAFRLPRRGLPRDPRLTVSELVQWGRNRGKAILRTWPNIILRDDGRRPGWLPLGTPAFGSGLGEIPPIHLRPVDVGFRGSIGQRRYSPKAISRRRMANELSRLSVGVAVDFAETASFAESFSLDPVAYVRSLLDTKICLAPRGTSVETFRTFEGALAGCVVITEPLPPAWFYAALPHLELSSWSYLASTVQALLSNPPFMAKMAADARNWAESIVSPTAIGQWVARQLRP